MNRKLLLAVSSALALTTGTASAAPFGTYDPRSMAMGGAGVASATSANASFFNPALLAAAQEEDDFSLELPMVGVRIADPDELITDLEDFQDSTNVDLLDQSVDNFNTNPSIGNQTAVVDAMAAVNNDVIDLSGRALEFGVTGATVIGIPGKKFGMAIFADGNASAAGRFEYRDGDTVTTLTQELNDFITLQTAIDSAISANDPVALATALQNMQTFADTSQFVTYDPLTQTATITDVEPLSVLQMRGLVIAEAGISMARNFNFGFGELAIGITPKFQRVTTVDFEAGAKTADITLDDGTVEKSDFNIDVGVAKDYSNGFKTGFVIKNLIPKSYETANNTGLGDIELKPQARIGIAHQTSWTTVAADLDITENDPVGLDKATRYLALGAELDIINTLQLRVGYRKNLVTDSYADVVTAGVGLSPFGVHVDVGAALSDEEASVGLQLGFRF